MTTETVDGSLIIMPTIRIKLVQYMKMVGWAVKHYPEEVCGMLSGPKSDGYERVADELHFITNKLHARGNYVMDEQQLATTLTYIKSHDKELTAIFHSHPDGPSFPSGFDVNHAYYDTVYIIISFITAGLEKPLTRAFTIDTEKKTYTQVGILTELLEQSPRKTVKVPAELVYSEDDGPS